MRSLRWRGSHRIFHQICHRLKQCEMMTSWQKLLIYKVWLTAFHIFHQADMTDKKLAKLHHSSHVQSAMRPHHGRSRGVLRRDHHWRSPDGGSSLKERNFGYCTCGCFQSVCFEFKVLLEFLFQRVNIFWNKWTHFRGRKICCSIPPCKAKCWRYTHEPFWSFHSRSWP